MPGLLVVFSIRVPTSINQLYAPNDTIWSCNMWSFRAGRAEGADGGCSYIVFTSFWPSDPFVAHGESGAI